MKQLERQNIKRLSKKEKFSLEEVLAEQPDYLIAQIRDELPKKPVKNGSQVRIQTLKNLCSLLEKQNRKLDAIYALIIDFNNRGDES